MKDGNICGQKYIGETSRSLAERIGEHIGDLRERKEKSVMWRHFKDDHSEEEHTYGLKVISSAPGDPLLRQLTEAILIEERNLCSMQKTSGETEISLEKETLGSELLRNNNIYKGPWRWRGHLRAQKKPPIT